MGGCRGGRGAWDGERGECTLSSPQPRVPEPLRPSPDPGAGRQTGLEVGPSVGMPPTEPPSPGQAVAPFPSRPPEPHGAVPSCCVLSLLRNATHDVRTQLRTQILVDGI